MTCTPCSGWWTAVVPPSWRSASSPPSIPKGDRADEYVRCGDAEHADVRHVHAVRSGVAEMALSAQAADPGARGDDRRAACAPPEGGSVRDRPTADGVP